MNRRECPHDNLDPSGAVGPGYVKCRRCGKSIPVERYLIQLNGEVQTLQLEMQQLREEVRQSKKRDKS